MNKEFQINIEKIQNELHEKSFGFLKEIMPIINKRFNYSAEIIFSFCTILEAFLEEDNKDTESELEALSDTEHEKISLWAVSKYKKDYSVLRDALNEKQKEIILRRLVNEKLRKEDE